MKKRFHHCFRSESPSDDRKKGSFWNRLGVNYLTRRQISNLEEEEFLNIRVTFRQFELVSSLQAARESG